MPIFEFDSFRVDALRRVLLHDGQMVRLPSKAFDILVVLLEADGRLVEKDELMQRVWPDAVVEENNLTVNMSVLRKALAESPGEHRYVVTVPGRGYQFVAKVKQQNGELQKAEVEQLLSESHKTSLVVDEVKKHRYGWWLVLGALVLILVYAVYSRRSTANHQLPITSIAVLPFANDTEDRNTEYLSDGISETLINKLSQLPDVKVIARSSAFRYKGTRADLKDVANELGVQAILTGRVIQRADDLSISAELVNATDKTQIWGERYDRKMSDLLTIESEITREIVANLKLKVSVTEQTYTANNEAYQLYLKGRFHWNKRTAEALQKGIEYFQQAIDKDPRFALAYVGLADCYVVPANHLPPHESMPKAKAAAMKALELDDRLAEAHTSLARVLSSYEWDWANAEREYKRAIELEPRYAVAHQWYGDYLAVMGRSDEAIAEKKRAVELEPVSLIINFELALGFYFNRDHDHAIEQLQKTLELDPKFPPAYNFLPAAYEQKHMYPEALVSFTQAVSLTIGSEGTLSKGGLGHLYATTGKKTQAQNIIQELKQLSNREYVPATSIAIVYAGLDEKDAAFTWLEEAYRQHAFQLQTINLEPRFDNLRSDPRFGDLLKRMGLLRRR